MLFGGTSTDSMKVTELFIVKSSISRIMLQIFLVSALIL